jgi:DNA-directed RNA polymerase
LKYAFTLLGNKLKILKQGKEVQTLYRNLASCFLDCENFYFPRDLDVLGRSYSISLLSRQCEESIRAALSFANGRGLTFSEDIQLKPYGVSLVKSAKLPEKALLDFIEINKDRILNFKEDKNLVWILEGASKPFFLYRKWKVYKIFVRREGSFYNYITVFSRYILFRLIFA